MIIQNIDAPEHLVEKVKRLCPPSYFSEVLLPLGKEFHRQTGRRGPLGLKRPIDIPQPSKTIPYDRGLSPLKQDNDYFLRWGYEIVFYLLHLIPIHLRASRPETTEDDDAIIDLLGAYFPNIQGDCPYIEMYLTAIDEASGGDDTHFKWLFTLILFHELAHAAMDTERLDKRQSVVSYKSTFGRWREESMANAVALRIIKDCGGAWFHGFAKQFVLSQPAEYALGVLMEDFDNRDFQDILDSKRGGVNYDLQLKWLEYVQGSPTWPGLHEWNDVLSRQYVIHYNGKYYFDKSKLAAEFIEAKLSEYESTHGERMSVTTFFSQFPRIKDGFYNIDLYEITDCIPDSRKSKYDETFRLIDGSVSVLFVWEKESFLEFARKAGLDCDYYQNF